jgi:flagellar hook assembly protein FlgD
LQGTASVTVEGTVQVRVAVYNEAGEVVRVIRIHELSSPVDGIELETDGRIESLNDSVDIYYQGYWLGEWDGTNARGNPAPNGVYYIKVDNVDAMGTVRSTVQQAMVSRTLYSWTVRIYNEAGEMVRDLRTFLGDPGPDGLTGMDLSSGVIRPTGDGGSGGGVPRQLTITLSNGVPVVWDGRNDAGAIVGTGNYFVEVHSNDGRGAESRMTDTVTVQAQDRESGLGKLMAWPNVVGGLGPSRVVFHTDSGLTMVLTVRVYTVSGELVGMAGPGPAGTVGWETRDVASGLYLAVVEARTPAGGFLLQRILKIVVKR